MSMKYQYIISKLSINYLYTVDRVSFRYHWFVFNETLQDEVADVLWLTFYHLSNSELRQNMFRIRKTWQLVTVLLHCQKNEMHYKIINKQGNRIESYLRPFTLALNTSLPWPSDLSSLSGGLTIMSFTVSIHWLMSTIWIEKFVVVSLKFSQRKHPSFPLVASPLSTPSERANTEFQ